MNEVAFDDLAVGQIFCAGPRPVERDAIIAFGREFDPQPQHVDEAAARESPFGALVASGWHTAAVTMRLLVDGAGPGFGAGAMGAGVRDLVWHRPVYPGDALSAESEVLELRPSQSRPDRGMVTLRTVTRNQGGEPVMTLTSHVLLRRK